MKKRASRKFGTVAALIGILVAGESVSAADELTIDSLDSPSSVTNWHYFWGTGGPPFWSNEDADGHPASGSLKFTNMFVYPGTWTNNAVSRTLNPMLDSGGYSNLAFDVRVEPVGVPGNDWSWYCDLSPMIFDSTWNGTNLTEWFPLSGTNWVHIEVPLKYTTNNTVLQEITMHAGGWDIQRPSVMWIDNLKLTRPPAQPTVSIKKAGSGVEFFASGPTYTPTGPYYNQFIRTAGGNYAWGGKPLGVTYSVTITDFPKAGPETPTYRAWLMLVGNATNPGASASWEEANVLFMEVATGSGIYGPYGVQTWYKVNAPGSDPWRYPLVSHWGLPKATGTLSITMTPPAIPGERPSITLNWPGGYATAQLTNSAESYFSSSTHVYVGVIPANVNNRGKCATISRVQVTGADEVLDDSFASLGNWVNLATDPAGVVLHPTTAACKLTWPTLPAGFQLYQRTEIVDGPWVLSPLPVSTAGNVKLAYPTENPPGGKMFYRLYKP